MFVLFWVKKKWLYRIYSQIKKRLINVENEKNRALDEIKELKTQLAHSEKLVKRVKAIEEEIEGFTEGLFNEDFLENLLSAPSSH